MKEMLKKIWFGRSIRHSVLYALGLGLLFSVPRALFLGWSALFMTLPVGIFFVYPILLTLINLIYIFIGKNNSQLRSLGRKFEYITICLGILYTLLYLPLTNIVFADWPEPLYNAQVHSPIWTAGVPTVAVLSLLGAAGYLALSTIPLKKTPPLLTVLSISAMYLGIMQCALWTFQVFAPDWRIWLCLLPVNCILISIKVIRQKINEWGEESPQNTKIFSSPFLSRINVWLSRSSRWPIAAFLLAWPLLGIVIAILVLFGQQPDSLVKAWTETSDWNLSQQISPQNVFYDEHYLCTVAAGGHRRLVKPLRMGERRGHPVIVNRQLCIANAFEQVLEERLPRLHRPIRAFYDRYGFPLARHIHSPYAADAIYLLMKPLEWFFLAVLYAVDVKPENRIAVQYLPAHSTQAPSDPT